MIMNMKLFILAVALLASLLFAAPVEEGVDEQSDPCSDYKPTDPIPRKPSKFLNSGLCKKILIPLGVAAGVGTASFFGPVLVLGALGFTGSGIAAGSTAAAIQSALYGGFVPAGGWFAAFQAAGATGVAIGQGAAIAIGATSGATTGATFFWNGKGKVPSSKQEWKEMDEKCESCVAKRSKCEPAKSRLFKQLELEKPRLGVFYLMDIDSEKMMEEENWESFVRLSCGCFPVFKNKKDGEGKHEKQLSSLFRYYVPFFYPTSNEDEASTSATCE